jgi:ribonuclease HII
MNGAAVLVAGVDETGRGCLAGPVYAAAVILPRYHGIRGMDDSKKLSREQREELAPKIRARALAWAVASATLEEIERLNILHASLLAMSRAVAALQVAPASLRVDGVHAPAVACPVETIIGGDAKVGSIMAASILAKVDRDAEMLRMHGQFPAYGFADNKGYGTPQHLCALREHGPCAIHRRFFAPVLQMHLDLAGSGAGVNFPAMGNSPPAAEGI